MLADQLDLHALRMAKLEADRTSYSRKLKEQVQEFGSTPPRAEKSKRRSGSVYQFTLWPRFWRKPAKLVLTYLRQLIASVELLDLTPACYLLGRVATGWMAGQSSFGLRHILRMT
jgi:hypothetical protein